MKTLLIALLLLAAPAYAFNTFDLRPLPNTPTHQIPDAQSASLYWRGFSDALANADRILTGQSPAVASFTQLAGMTGPTRDVFQAYPAFFYFQGRIDAFLAVADAVGENKPVNHPSPAKAKLAR